ncbi:MAG: rhodanese-like domain-containing protein [Bacteroidales bacterium]|nr:rhodanese-like domain-containing protein [Bacteroidales bacterium]
MKNIKVIISLILVSLIVNQVAFAQKLISAKDLKAKKGVVIIDTRSADDYAKTHIKGSINIDSKTLEKPGTIKGILKSPEQVAAIFGENGVSKDAEIVLYCKTGVNAGRVYWVLTYLGAKNVSILDGQLGGWMAVRGPITNAKTTLTKTTFTPSVNKSLFANKAYVSSKLKGASTIIIDARKAEDFKAGNIPGSINIPKEEIVTSKYNFKDKASLQALFAKAGVSSNKEIIVSCESGSRAGTMFFVLTGILNYPNVKVYDGSYNEWKGL